MIPFTQQSLTEYLKSQGYNVEPQKETNQIYYTYKGQRGEFPVFLRIYENNEQLQILTFFPMTIMKNRMDTIARLLHVFNREIDLPGFGIDEEIGVAFHRIMIPVFGNDLSTGILDLYLKAVPTICDKFFPLLYSASQSNQSFDEIKKKVAETRASMK